MAIAAYLAFGCSSCFGTHLEGQTDASSDPDVESIVDVGTDLVPDTEVDTPTDPTMDPPAPDCSLDGEIDIDASHWILRMGGPDDEWPSNIAVAHDGHLLLSGWHREGSGASHAWFVEVDGEGEIIDQMAIDGVLGVSTPENRVSPPSIVPLRDCGRLLVGATKAYGFGGIDVWLARLDASGMVVWQKALGGPGHDWSAAAIETRDGGFLIVSMTTESTSSREFYIWLARLTSDGSLVWQKRIDDKERYFYGPRCLLESDDGTAIVVIEKRALTEGPDIVVLGVDSSGNLVRQVFLEGGSMYEHISVREAFFAGADLVLAGDIHIGGKRAWLARLAPSGELTWQKAYHSDRPSYLLSATPLSDDSMLVTGLLQLETGDERYSTTWLASINGRGDIAWQRFMTDGEGTWGGVHGVVSVHLDNTVLATAVDAIVSGTEETSDVVLARLSEDGTLSGECSLLQDAPARSQDTFVTTVETEIVLNPGFGGVTEAHASFFDPDIPVHTLCSE